MHRVSYCLLIAVYLIIRIHPRAPLGRIFGCLGSLKMVESGSKVEEMPKGKDRYAALLDICSQFLTNSDHIPRVGL